MKNKSIALSLVVGIISNAILCTDNQKCMMLFEKDTSKIRCTVRSYAPDTIQKFQSIFTINPDTNELLPTQTVYRIPETKYMATICHDPRYPNHIPMDQNILKAINGYTQFATNPRIYWTHNPVDTPASNLAEALRTYALILRVHHPSDGTLKDFTRRELVRNQLGTTN